VRRLALVVLLALAVPAATSAAVSPRISQSEIAGVQPGMTRAEVRAVLERRGRLDRLEGGLTRLAYPQLRVEVYFRDGRDAAVDVLTWGERYRTAKRIGPCSSELDLRAAYGSLRRTVLPGGEVAYHLGRLVFDVRNGRVLAVVLGRGTATPYLAANSLGCGEQGG